MYSYHARVSAIGDDGEGEEFLVGQGQITALNPTEACSKAMDAWWDRRLDVASCLAVVRVRRARSKF